MYAGLPHVLFVDYSLDELRPARVVRILVPGLDTPGHGTSPRTRAAVIAGLW